LRGGRREDGQVQCCDKSVVLACLVDMPSTPGEGAGGEDGQVQCCDESVGSQPGLTRHQSLERGQEGGWAGTAL
jgi:hypothetical protein